MTIGRMTTSPVGSGAETLHIDTAVARASVDYRLRGRLGLHEAGLVRQLPIAADGKAVRVDLIDLDGIDEFGIGALVAFIRRARAVHSRVELFCAWDLYASLVEQGVDRLASVELRVPRVLVG
ncbi:MAG: hypothetical protein AB7L13_12255 [Acidimicrobiia bacterium]